MIKKYITSKRINLLVFILFFIFSVNATSELEDYMNCINDINCTNATDFITIPEENITSYNNSFNEGNIFSYNLLNLTFLSENYYSAENIINGSFVLFNLGVRNEITVIDNITNKNYTAILFDENQFGRIYLLKELPFQIKANKSVEVGKGVTVFLTTKLDAGDKMNMQSWEFMASIFIGGFFVIIFHILASEKRSKSRRN